MTQTDDGARITEIVAIDGPAGAGKSSAARQAARILGFAFLDTGAMYRAATWWALHRHVDLDDPMALAESTRQMELRLTEDNGVLRVRVGQTDVTNAIRSPEVTRLIYRLDQNALVRERLVSLQRQFGAGQPTVAEGRDIGTVVFPKAKCKIYLDASIEERARRRCAELQAQGAAVDLGQLREEIHERDLKSMTRAVSPLRRAEDAVLVDTTDMTLDQAVDTIVRLARERI